MSEQKITAQQVKQALSKRHKDDMFFTEVKDGPTQIVNHHSKIDALAIRISWTNYAIIGYEVKVSRSDFIRDEKWRAYLPMCNQLYFAVAPGIVEPSEIPDCCGLVQMTAGGGLRTIKKAPWRDIEEPVNMYRYLMFNYIGPLRNRERDLPRCLKVWPSQGAEKWRDYLADKMDMNELGRQVSSKLFQEVRELRRKQERVTDLEEQLNDHKKALVSISNELGVSNNVWSPGANIIEGVRQLKASGGISKRALQKLQQIQSDASAVLMEIGGNESEH